MNRHLTIRSAPLPASYEEARNALAKCEHTDECQDWADKMAALASYARQAKDDFLLIKARRIQLRAIERGGELLSQVKAAPGRPPKIREGDRPILGREAAATDAGLSEHQRKTMLRVAAVPDDVREQMIEAARTVSELAERGTKRKAVKPEPYKQEWANWVFAIKRLRDLPDCGLDILARRDSGLTTERLLADARAAKANIENWITALEARR